MYKLQVSKWFIFITCFCVICLIGCKNDRLDNSSPANAGLENVPEEYTAPAAYWGFIDTSGKVAISPQFDDVRPFSNGLAVVNIKGKWGAVDHKGVMAIPADYAALSDFRNNLALAVTSTGEKYFIHAHNKKVLDCPFTDCQPFKGDYAVIQDNELFGLIDRNGKILIKPEYVLLKADEHYAVTTAGDESGSLVRLRDMRLIFSIQGQIFLPSEDVFRYSQDSQLYYRHITGRAIAGPVDAGSDIKQGFASVTHRDKVFMLHISGQQTETPCTQIHYAGEQLWFCRQQDKNYTLLKTVLQSVVPHGNIGCRAFTRFSEGLAGCMNEQGKWGYIDTEGTMVTQQELPLAWDMREGRVRMSGLLGYGYLDRRGKEIIPMQFFEARDFYEGKAAFQDFPE